MSGQKAGLDGIVCSPEETSWVRKKFKKDFLIVTPGIRPVINNDDQKRTVNVEQAFLNGADYIVVGRPIKDAKDPKKAALEIQQTITSLFKG